MEKLFVHMGVPKTGTSALQVFLARNRRKLLESGFDYLGLGEILAAAEGQITSGNAGPLARVFFPEGHFAHAPDPDQVFVNQFRHVIRATDAHTGILSSELLSGLNDDGMKAFRDMVQGEGLTLTILAYIRRQDRRMAANYAQEVKRHGCTLYPDEYVEKTLPKSGGMNYNHFTNRLDGIFGRDNVLIRVYEETAQYKGRVIEDFMRTLTGDFSPDSFNMNVANVNPTPSAKELKFMLQVNRFAPHIAFSDDVLAYGDLVGREGGGGPTALLAPELRQRILDHFAESNQRLAQNRFNREVLFETTVEPAFEDLRHEPLSNEDWIDILSHLSVNHQRRLFRLERDMKMLKNQVGRLESPSQGEA